MFHISFHLLSTTINSRRRSVNKEVTNMKLIVRCLICFPKQLLPPAREDSRQKLAPISLAISARLCFSPGVIRTVNHSLVKFVQCFLTLEVVFKGRPRSEELEVYGYEYIQWVNVRRTCQRATTTDKQISYPVQKI